MDYKIAYDDQNVIVTFNKNLIDPNTLSVLLDYINLESIRKKSKLTDEQIEILAKEIDQNVWNKLEQKVKGI